MRHCWGGNRSLPLPSLSRNTLRAILGAMATPVPEDSSFLLPLLQSQVQGESRE